jgi:hypothetical protein
MAKLYEYRGLNVFFYSNESNHPPAHVHGSKAGRESKADLVVVNGIVVEIRLTEVRGRLPLAPKDLANFRLLVENRAGEILKKWYDYFVFHRGLKLVRIHACIK